MVLRRQHDVPDRVPALDQEGVTSVFDPACGQGGFLVAAASAAPGARLAGQDVNADTSRIAAQRLYVHGQRADIRLADSLTADAFAGQQFDAVVCDPPWGLRLRGANPPEDSHRGTHGTGRADLLWLRPRWTTSRLRPRLRHAARGAALPRRR